MCIRDRPHVGAQRTRPPPRMRASAPCARRSGELRGPRAAAERPHASPGRQVRQKEPERLQRGRGRKHGI
eukprot:12344701-Alexandrium_andersonii.AAC.1